MNLDKNEQLNVGLLKIELLVDKPVINETLNRIGILNFKQKIVYPSCYLYSLENGCDYLLHFKQIFLLKSEYSYNNISIVDLERRNAIAFCLKKWNLIKVDDDDIIPHNIKIDIIPYSQKFEWAIRHKIDLN